MTMTMMTTMLMATTTAMMLMMRNQPQNQAQPHVCDNPSGASGMEKEKKRSHPNQINKKTNQIKPNQPKDHFETQETQSLCPPPLQTHTNRKSPATLMHASDESEGRCNSLVKNPTKKRSEEQTSCMGWTGPATTATLPREKEDPDPLRLKMNPSSSF